VNINIKKMHNSKLEFIFSVTLPWQQSYEKIFKINNKIIFVGSTLCHSVVD